MVTMGKWIQERSRLEKFLLLLSSILIFIVFVLIIVVAVSQGSGDVPGGNGPTCWTKGCIKTAGQMLSKISEDSNPCTSFYDYACGGYSNISGQITSVAQTSMDTVYLSIKNILESSTDIDSPDIRSMRAMYRSCMEYDGLQDGDKKPDEALRLLMDKVGVGTWPVIDIYFDVDSTLSLEERLVGLLLVGVPVAYKVDIVPNPRENGSFIMKLSPGGPFVAGRLEKDIRGDAQLRTHMLSSFLLLGASSTRASADVDDILSVDNHYATIELAASTECDSIDALTPEESLSALTDLIPGTDWSFLLNAIQKVAGLSRPIAVQVYCKEKIKEYLDYLADLSVRSAYNYLGWRFFTTFDMHIMPALRRPEAINGVGYARWKDCVRLLEQYAAPSLAQALTIHEVKNSTIVKVKEVSNNIKSSLDSLLSTTKWLDKEEKTITKRQLNSTKIHFPFIQKLDDKESPFLKFSEVNTVNYTMAVIELKRQWVIQKLKNLNPSDVHVLDMRRIHLTTNSIPPEASYAAITFDKTQEPYFTSDGPDWINFGGLGISTARGLSKSLIAQNLGVSIEDTTTLWDIWYRDASGCFLNSLASRFGLTDGNELVKIKWIKELFLDASSLEIAYQSSMKSTSKKKLPGLSRSAEQLFFIAYAQTMCAAANSAENYRYIPIRDRLNAVVSNSKHFNQVFSCSASSTCEIWS